MLKKLRILEKQCEKAEYAGAKIRHSRTNCECCKKEVNNLSKENGIYYELEYYYVWNDQFLCDKCFSKIIFLENAVYLLLLFFVSLPIVIPMNIGNWIYWKISNLSWKIVRIMRIGIWKIRIICTVEQIIRFLLNAIMGVLKNIFLMLNKILNGVSDYFYNLHLKELEKENFSKALKYHTWYFKTSLFSYNTFDIYSRISNIFNSIKSIIFDNQMEKIKRDQEKQDKKYEIRKLRNLHKIWIKDMKYDLKYVC